MVIANGFVTPTATEALEEVKRRCEGSKVRKIPLPTVRNMTYWVSERGEVFGCQRSSNMCLTKPLHVESRYKTGAHFRYAVGKGKQANAFMQNVMYATFVSGEYKPDKRFDFKDGNPYNYRLTNIEPKRYLANEMLSNSLETLKGVYDSSFMDVAWYIRKWYDIPLDDCKDIASDTFIYLCSTHEYVEPRFVGIWKKMVRVRAIDWLERYANKTESLCHEDGEERFESETHDIEVADIWGCLRGEKRKQYLRLWSEGENTVEIAKHTGSMPSTVRSELCRAVQELRKSLKKDILVYEKEKHP